MGSSTSTCEDSTRLGRRSSRPRRYAASFDAFAVPGARIPAGFDAQVCMYRSLLAGLRVLVLLDNARDVGQVRPLLPGTPGCLVIATSRNRLTGLILAEHAQPLTLGLLSPAEAHGLLASRASP